MAIIRPFKAIRPKSELVNMVAALPYDVMNSDEAREMAKENPYSFLHVDKAEIDLDKDTYIYDKKVYEKAKDNLDTMIKNKILIQDKEPCLYIYRLIMSGKSQTGLVACTSIDEYINDTIKKHELTREEKEIDRINHVDYCNANTGPIFLAYHEETEIIKVIEKWTLQYNPEYSFKSEDMTSQQVWVINDTDVINQLVNLFKDVPSFYIADGHHRNASAVKVGLKRRQENPDYTGDEEFNYYLSVIFPDNQLNIMDYNRLVKDLNGLTEDEFLNKLNDKFSVQKCEDNKHYEPKKMHTFGMYLNRSWYFLSAKNEFIDNSDLVSRLDVSVLQKEILEPLLGIKDARTDERIDFVGGIRGLEELVKRVDSGEMTVAFSMYPTSIEELMAISDAGKIMPPKSTWFEPKLRSGLFIHSLE